MVYQNRLETANIFIVAIRASRNSEWFSIISDIVFEVNIVVEQIQVYFNDFFVVCKFLLLSTFFYCPLPYRCSGVSVAKHASHVCFWNRIDIFHPSGGSKSAVLGDAVGKGAKSQRKESADQERSTVFLQRARCLF